MDDGRWTNSRLGRYMLAAALARSMDSGSTVGITLLALSLPGVAHPVQLAGWLAAARTLPYLLAPVTARWVNRLADPRPAIAAGVVLFAAGVAATVATLGRLPLVVSLAMAAIAGLAGPLLTGGLSSIVGSTATRAGKRRSGLDAITYNLGSTFSPAAVSVLAAVWQPRTATLCLAVLGLVAAGLILTLPVDRTREVDRSVGISTLAAAIVGIPGLRRTTIISFAAMIASAGAMILGIARVEATSPAAAGFVAVAMGLGAMLGNLIFSARPLAASSDDAMTLDLAVLVPILLVVAFVPGVWAQVAVFTLYGFMSTPINVMSITARGEYAPAALQSGIFVTIAGVKMGIASLGPLLAGQLARYGYSVALACLAGFLVVMLLVVLADRALSARREVVSET